MRGTNKILALAALMAAHPTSNATVDFGADFGVEKAIREHSMPVRSHGARMSVGELDAWARKRRRARQTHPGKRGKS